MKLRNKKTGEIKDIQMIIHEAFTSRGVETLMHLEGEWEDYKPAEPLIKDEKIRKAVRAWAEANDLIYFKVCKQHFGTFRIIGKEDKYSSKDLSIEFSGSIEASEKITYKIDQLCGEKENGRDN